MRSRCCVVLLSFLSLFAKAQDTGNGVPPTQNPFHGVKIISSQFTSSASPQTVTLDFINDSPSNITAWAYCLRTEKVDAADPYQGHCIMFDASTTVVDKAVQEKLTSRSNDYGCEGCSVIHPGEHHLLSGTLSLPVLSAAIEINLIAYSDGTAETDGSPEGVVHLNSLISARKGWIQREQELADIGRHVLANTSDPHPAQTMIGELENRSKTEPWIEGTLRVFKTPEWRHANNKEFIPDDERGYLTNFVSEQEQKAAELARYQITGATQ